MHCVIKVCDRQNNQDEQSKKMNPVREEKGKGCYYYAEHLISANRQNAPELRKGAPQGKYGIHFTR